MTKDINEAGSTPLQIGDEVGYSAAFARDVQLDYASASMRGNVEEIQDLGTNRLIVVRAKNGEIVKVLESNLAIVGSPRFAHSDIRWKRESRNPDDVIESVIDDLVEFTGNLPDEHNKLSPEQHAEIKKEVVGQGVPVRFMVKGRALNITTGELTQKFVNVIHQITYWNFTKDTAKKIGEWLGARPVW